MQSGGWAPDSSVTTPLPERRARFLDAHFWVGFASGIAAGLCLCFGGLVALALVMAHVIGSQGQNAQGQGASALLSAPPFPGVEKADYDFTLERLDGTSFDAHALQGKVVLLNFWATWCGPCRLEMPSLQRFYEKTTGENVAVAAISDETREAIIAFLKKNPYTFPIYRVAGAPPKVYRSDAIPATFLLSPDGRIAFKHIGSAAWDDASTFAFLRTLSPPPR